LGKALMGKFWVMKMGVEHINSWIQKHRSPGLEYYHVFHLLEKGWIGFIFHMEEDASKILRGQWFYDLALLSLKPQYPEFDSHEEFSKSTLVWMKLPQLPMELWNDASLNNIENSLGKFILADKSYKIQMHIL